MPPLYIIIIALLTVLNVVVLVLLFRKSKESPEKRAGDLGEVIASNVIRDTLKGGDILFCNLYLSYDGKKTELDNVIVNKNGVFIIEVKNYTGKLIGSENDFVWKKTKTTFHGNSYTQEVKNPVRQVKRQTYILAHYLESHGVKVWVEGYAILLQGNCPINSRFVLYNKKDIDRRLHKTGKANIDNDTVKRIVKILGKAS